MRWFFLPFIPLLAVLGNAVLLEHVTVLKLLGVIAFNIFVLSLCFVWWYSYFREGWARERGLALGAGLLSLSLGGAFVLIGTDVVASSDYSSLLSSSRPNGFRNQLVRYADSLSLCPELGLVVVGIGLLLMYPSLRLFVALARRS